MSRLSKITKKVRLAPIVTQYVQLAQVLLGAGTGEIKKRLVQRLVSETVKALKEIDLPIPDNLEVIVDELIEQAVELRTGWEIDEETEEEQPSISVSTTSTAGRRGRPKGSKNTPKETVTPKPAPAQLDVTDIELDDEDQELLDKYL